MIAQIKGGANDAASISGDAPAAGARNLGNQSVSVKASKDAADFLELAFFASLTHCRK
jgi:hypothetical protein